MKVTYAKTTVDRYDPGTQLSLPAGYVGRVTGGGTARVAVDSTQYPGHWFVPATQAEYEAQIARRREAFS